MCCPRKEELRTTHVPTLYLTASWERKWLSVLNQYQEQEEETRVEELNAIPGFSEWFYVPIALPFHLNWYHSSHWLRNSKVEQSNYHSNSLEDNTKNTLWLYWKPGICLVLGWPWKFLNKFATDPYPQGGWNFIWETG